MERKSHTAILGGIFITDQKTIKDHVLVFGDKIEAIIPKSDFDMKYDRKSLTCIDVCGSYVAPGFVDLHIHGAGGADVMDGTDKALETLSAQAAHTGTTSLLATTLTADWTSIQAALESVQRAMKRTMPGAHILGAHLEGPYLSLDKKGAHDARWLDTPLLSHIAPWSDVIRLITLAPERAGAMAFIEAVGTRFPHIVLSMGHSQATYEEAMTAIGKGIRSTTHLFNAMSGLHHRDPGMVGAALDSDVNVELIADGVHVHAGAMSLAWKLKGPDQLTLVTDAMRATCLKCGQYDLGGLEVTVDETSARLADGTLAGSILTMDRAVYNMVQQVRAPLAETIFSATGAPAALLGLKGRKGTLQPGADADIVLLSKSLKVMQTIVNGNTVYTR